MKVLVYTDLQATDGSERCFTQPGAKLQHYRVSLFFDKIWSIFKEEKCGALYDLGDTTDDRVAIPIGTIDVLLKKLRLFTKYRDANWKLVGNHEHGCRDARFHAGPMFDATFNVVEGIHTIFIAGKTAVIFVAYPPDEVAAAKAIQEEILRQRGLGFRVILLGHLPVYGSLGPAGEIKSGIPKQALANVDLGLLGHVHRPQSILPNVHYIGSPFQQDYGEAGEDKRVAILDTEKATVKWIPMHGFPQYHTITLPEFLEGSWENDEDRLKVILRSPDEAQQFYSHPLHARYHPITNYSEQLSGDEQAATSSSFDTSDIFRRYMERVKPVDRNVVISKDELLEYGLELLR